MADEQDAAEGLDADKIDDDVRVDEDGLGVYPRHQMLGANQYGVTAAEERWDEPHDERMAREEPEPLVEELDRSARRDLRVLRDPDDDTELVGVLTGVDDRADDGELRVDLTDEGTDRWPEDRAMHLQPEAD